MTLHVTKLSAWIPWSEEDLENFGDGLYFHHAQGWPNRCASFLGVDPRPCFMHTRFSETCA